VTCEALLDDPGGHSLRGRYSIEPGRAQIEESTLIEVGAVGTIRFDCSGDVLIAALVRASGDGGKTFNEGRAFRAVTEDDTITAALPKTLDASTDFLLMEANGKPARAHIVVRRHDGRKIGEKTYDIAAFAQRLIDLSKIRRVESSPRVEISISGEGGLVISRESHDAALIELLRSKPETAKVSAVAAASTPVTSSIENLLGVASFKAAPFREPMTGLVYMRDRWYDPHSGSFLSPDPEGYADSASLYSYCHGDPVNCTDPTGRMDGSDVREDFRQKENAERARRAAEWCREHPADCLRRDIRGGAILKGISAAGQTVAGVTTFASTGPLPEPLTKTLGAVTAARGLENLGTAAAELWTGERRGTPSGQALYLALRKAGKSPAEAARISGLTEAGVDLGTTLASGTLSAMNSRLAAAAPRTLPGLTGLRFGSNDLVYGPSAGRYLRALRQETGGVILDDLLKPETLSWEEFSTQTLDSAAVNGRMVRFDLTHVEDLPGVLNNTGEWASTVTAHELRYLQSNWSRFRNVTHFYKNGVEVAAPWLK
jgi:RHS repeat-associated protein